MFGVQKLTTHQKQLVLGSALFWVWVVNFRPFRARMIKVNYLVTTIMTKHSAWNDARKGEESKVERQHEGRAARQTIGCMKNMETRQANQRHKENKNGWKANKDANTKQPWKEMAVQNWSSNKIAPRLLVYALIC